MILLGTFYYKEGNALLYADVRVNH